MIVVVGLLVDQDRCLIQKRPDNKPRGGLWEFPGGKREPGETMRQALVREWQEELGIRVYVGGLVTETVITFPDVGEVLLPLFLVYTAAVLPAIGAEGQTVRYATVNDIKKLPVVPTMPEYLPYVKSICG